MCSTLKTTEPREPNNKAHDSAHACPHRCEVSITGGLGSRLLPVSLTARGVTGAGEGEGQALPSGCRENILRLEQAAHHLVIKCYILAANEDFSSCLEGSRMKKKKIVKVIVSKN